METSHPAAWPARVGAALRSRWALPVLVLAAVAASVALRHLVYADLSWNRDEPVYLWHVEVLRAGQLSTPDGGYRDLLQPWLSAARDGQLFSQYTLGWPLVLALGAVLGTPDLGLAAGAALAVAGTWSAVHALLRDRAVATVAAAAMLLSPILAVQAGAHLNYLFTLGLGLFFLTNLWVGVRTTSWGRLLAAGALLGWVFLTRPYDAAVWGLVGVVPVLLEHRSRPLSLLRPAATAAAGLLPFVAGALLYNRHLTGSATEFPITVADPLDQFGFGTRRLMPRFDTIAYGPRLAAESAGRNIFWFPFFLLGAHLGLVVAALGAWRRRREAAAWVLIGLGVAFPLAYFAFFGTHISSLTARLSGPIYYIPAYVPLAALIALALVDLGRRHPTRALAVAALLIVATAPVTASRLDVNRRLSEANAPWRASNESIEGRALVVTSPSGYLLFVNPFASNGADLDGRVLFAADNGPEVLQLVLDQPDRTPYLQRADLSVVDLLPSEDPRTPNVSLTPLEVLRGDVRLAGRAVPDPTAAASAWWVEVDGQVIGDVHPLSSATDLDLAVPDLDLPEGLHTLDVLVGRGDDLGEAARSPHLRRTFYVRVTGGAVDLLAPGTAARRVARSGDPQARWEDALTLEDLTVRAVLGG